MKKPAITAVNETFEVTISPIILEDNVLLTKILNNARFLFGQHFKEDHIQQST